MRKIELKKVKKNKRAFFFTISAIFLIILVISFISTKNTYRYREKQESLETRAKTINYFIDDFEKDLERELFIGGYRAIISMTSYLKNIQNFINDTNFVFSEVFLNGTINNTEIDLMKQDNNGFITGADFKSWLLRINEEAEKLNINVKADVKNITIYHEDPFNITIELEANLIFEDLNNLLKFNYTKKFFKKIPITGFEDPLYIVSTKDKISNVINITTEKNFVDESNISGLIKHYQYSYYKESNKAPSFLMRFSGNFSESIYGIESMIYLPEYYAQFGNYKDRSVIDYIYFGNQSLTFYCNITGMPNEFKIDSLHLIDYEINELNYSNC
ncbi:MAG: hypothetical protein QXR96_00125 [Candidatus Woesearchaeota archaeon]